MSLRRKVLLVVAGIVALVVLLDFLIVTDSERLEDLMDQVREALLASDVNMLVGLLADDYEHEGYTAADLDRHASKWLPALDLVTVRYLKSELFVLEDEANIVVGCFTSSGPNAGMPGSQLSSWQFKFEKRGDEWVIVGIELKSIGQNAVGLRDILGP